MRAAEAGSGASSWELMQRAGAGCAEWVWRVAAGRAVTILCGPGNNGGDGYVVAEILRARGLEVAVVAPRPPTSEPACEARARFKGAVAPGLAGARKGVLVDALFGFGLSRPLADPFANLLQEALATHCYSIAIDLPSGVDADTGADLGHQGPRDLTLALGAWKRAHFLMPASAAMGARRLVDIGVAPPAGSDRAAERPRLRPPAADSHKYRRGLLAIVAGAMPGAALLAAEAALRSGAGYVKLLGAAFGPAIPAELVAEPGAVEDRLADPRFCAALVGPGLGRDARARASLAAVLDRAIPTVIDGDALHLLDWDAIEGVATARLLLTPHEGELAALCAMFGISAEGKLERAAALRDATGASILAKGPDTLLAPAGGGLVFFPPGSPWLSAAGTGDVLAGIAASRLAHHADASLAGEEAVWLHHRAARMAGPGFTSAELARAVGPALAAFLR